MLIVDEILMAVGKDYSNRAVVYFSKLFNNYFPFNLRKQQLPNSCQELVALRQVLC